MVFRRKLDCRKVGEGKGIVGGEFGFLFFWKQVGGELQ